MIGINRNKAANEVPRFIKNAAFLMQEAVIYERKDPDISLALYMKALNNFTEDCEGKADCCNQIGKVLLSKNLYKEAIKYLEYSFEFRIRNLDNLDNLSLFSDIHRDPDLRSRVREDSFRLAKAYCENGNILSGLEMFHKSCCLADSKVNPDFYSRLFKEVKKVEDKIITYGDRDGLQNINKQQLIDRVKTIFNIIQKPAIAFYPIGTAKNLTNFSQQTFNTRS